MNDFMYGLGSALLMALWLWWDYKRTFQVLNCEGCGKVLITREGPHGSKRCYWCGD